MKLQEMNQDVKLELKRHIVEQVEKTFVVLFNVKVKQLDDIRKKFNDDDLVTRVSMHQEGIEAILRFAFPRQLLKPLLLKIYPPELARHESIFEDAACEITNIVCSSLKTFLNENDYTFSMEIPKIDGQFGMQKDGMNENEISLDFVLTDEGFTVDFVINTKIEQEKKK